MAKVIQKDLLHGVRLTAVPTDKFKTSTLAVTLLAPLTEETAAENALLPAVLRRGTERYPDMESLSGALDYLYGGAIEPAVRKKGETQCLGFVASFLDDAYALDGGQILEPMAQLVGDLFLHPTTTHGMFREDYVESERTNLLDRIQAQMNEKRSYAHQRLAQEMCQGEPYGIDRLGTQEGVKQITTSSLWNRYQALLRQSEVSIYYCGSANIERVETALLAAFADLPRDEELDGLDCTVQAGTVCGQPNLVTEAMDVTQGKLVMGFRTGGACVWTDNYPALLVFNALYGGTATSKLFLNVREKLSLCYFASSLIEKCKGIMLVSAGIEFDKYDAAKDEILLQLEACCKGEIAPWEMEGAKRSIVSSLHAAMDAQSRTEDYWLGQIVADLDETPEELAARIEEVTLEEVCAVAQGMDLDTIYFLKGREE